MEDLNLYPGKILIEFKNAINDKEYYNKLSSMLKIHAMMLEVEEWQIHISNVKELKIFKKQLNVESS